MPSLGKALYITQLTHTKQSYYIPAIPAAGAILGAVHAPQGHRLRGAGIGAVKGLGTDIGGGVGAIGGLLGGGALGGLAGGLGGASIGGLLGLGEEGGGAVVPGMLAGGAYGGAAGGLAGSALGGLAGIPYGMYKGFQLSDKYLPSIRNPHADNSTPEKSKEKSKSTEKKEPEKKEKKDKE